MAGGCPRPDTPGHHHDEVTFLAPLDPVSASAGPSCSSISTMCGKSISQHISASGAITRCQFCGATGWWRVDLRLDRQTRTLVVCGFWLEETTTGQSARFAAALLKGIERLMVLRGPTGLMHQA